MVTNDDMTFNQEKYEAYSPLFMSTTYAIVYGISFCLATASIVHVVLYSGKDIYRKFRKTATEDEDVHMKLMRNYPEVADWWYWVVFLVCTVLAIIAVEVSPHNLMLGYLLSG
jgi:xanthine/uracil/vitamin C permease (AzgA family)